MRHSDFERNFDELAALAYRTSYRILGSRAEAEEITQDTLIKAMVRWRTVRPHARPWVCRVAANAALGVVRRRHRQPSQLAVTPVDDPSDAITRIDLQRLLVSLPRRQRGVVVLRFLADLSEADVARELGVSAGSVETHTHRALAALRGALDPGPATGKEALDV